MIERDFIAQKTKEHYIKSYIESKLAKSGISSIKLKKIPLGEKIIINTSRPSLIVGSKGSNIRELTKDLKREFKLENPQIEINEIRDIFLDPVIVAEKIALYMERFGSARFKSIGHKIMENIIKSGALGVEIVISGKIPSSRAKRWRFNQGYLKKSGDASLEGVKKFKTIALLKSGVVGIKVSIMPPDFVLPDRIQLREELPGQEAGQAASESKKEAQDEKAKKKRSGAKPASKTGTKPKSSSPKSARKPKKEELADAEAISPEKKEPEGTETAKATKGDKGPEEKTGSSVENALQAETETKIAGVQE